MSTNLPPDSSRLYEFMQERLQVEKLFDVELSALQERREAALQLIAKKVKDEGRRISKIVRPWEKNGDTSSKILYRRCRAEFPTDHGIKLSLEVKETPIWRKWIIKEKESPYTEICVKNEIDPSGNFTPVEDAIEAILVLADEILVKRGYYLFDTEEKADVWMNSAIGESP